MPPLPQPADQSSAGIAERLEHGALLELIARLEQYAAPAAPGSNGWYDWLPLPLGTYLDGMRAARAYLGPGRHQYLEVGSGIGTKLILAHALGFEAQGIERHAPYVQVSRALAPHCAVAYDNAAQALSTYRTAALIYNYSIATDPTNHHYIGELIAAQMTPGALYFTARQPFPSSLEPMAPNVWIKP